MWDTVLYWFNYPISAWWLLTAPPIWYAVWKFTEPKGK